MQPITLIQSRETAPLSEPYLSIAIFAWNEEKAIATVIKSLLEQSIFAHLEARQLQCEIVCVLNGCTDRTAEIAEDLFVAAERDHPDRHAFSGRVENLTQRGKINAWNQYVHSVSARSAQYLIMMDADIVMHPKDTLLSMITALERNQDADVAVDQPCKDIASKSGKSISERISLDMSRMTKAADGQLCGQLYCIRAAVARKIYLPRDLPACEDGFIKSMVCTGFLSHEVRPQRIRVAEGAAHTFEAYTSPGDILKNQKRQIIGQTAVHILVDHHLKNLSGSARQDLAGVLRDADQGDPMWLKRLIAEHVRTTRYFWQLYPGLLSQRFKHLSRLSPLKRLVCLPAAAASVAVGFIASFGAWQTLKSGSIAYWPKANRGGLDHAATAVNTSSS